MNVLITGASGFLGGALVRCLGARRDTQVTGLAHRQGGAGLVACDLRDADAWRALLRAQAPDVVVHSAAYREPDYCEQHPDEAPLLNVAPARVMAEVMPPSARVVLISTDYVFDGTQPPYAETATRHPLSVYGRTKLAAEDALLTHPGALVLRIPVLVGAGPTLAQSGYIGQLVACVRDKRPVDVDNVLVRVPTWIEDVAEALAFLLARDARGVFHMAGPQAATRYASAREVAALLGESDAHLHPSHAVVPRPAPRPLNSQLATAKLKSLGFARFTAFPDVVRAVLAAVAGR